MTKSKHLPLARKEGLLIERLSDEVLIYDLARKKAHCLNQAAALIWDHCDGKTSVAEMAGILQDETGEPVGTEVVWFALDQFGKTRLLERPLSRQRDADRLSRRQLIRRIGLAASVPLVMSVLAPKASAVLSCATAPCPGGSGCVSPCQCNTGTSMCTA